jgi:hypothetical protein
VLYLREQEDGMNNIAIMPGKNAKLQKNCAECEHFQYIENSLYKECFWGSKKNSIAGQIGNICILDRLILDKFLEMLKESPQYATIISLDMGEELNHPLACFTLCADDIGAVIRWSPVGKGESRLTCEKGLLFTWEDLTGEWVVGSLKSFHEAWIERVEKAKEGQQEE